MFLLRVALSWTSTGFILGFTLRHGLRDGDEDARDRIHRPGTLYAAGLITGEALMGIAIAVPIVAAGRADVLALPEGLVPGAAAGQWLGLAVLAAVGWLLYRVSTRRQSGEAA